MDWYALATLDDAIDETRSLLTPVRVGVWLRLAVITAFAGGATGTWNVSLPVDAVPMWSVQGTLDAPPDISVAAPRLLALAAAVLVLLALIGLLGSVMEFVLVAALRSRAVALGRPFRASMGRGLRIFVFRAVLGAVVLVPAAAMVGLLFLGVTTESVLPAVVAVVLVPVVAVLAVAAAVASAATTSFVVPLMADRGIGVIDGWRAFWPTLRGELRQFAVYAVVRFVLFVVAGVLTSIVTGAFAVPIALAVGGLTLGGVPTIVVAGAVALAALLALALLVAVQVPVTTYLRYHSLLVLDASTADFTLRPNTERSDNA